ncbi:acyltransferase family protein [Leptolyngbyaceae cyanobacterium JSC-12]|nr:acyltransferase family protein [Leptolyngbyaceae cyanobacterium JSC-12]
MTTPLVHQFSQQNQTQEHCQKPNKLRFESFDYLRAIFSVVIVADHVALFGLATIMNVTTLSDILYANVSCVAVPVFFQISLFLFYIKSESLGFQYLARKRLPKLIGLYLFWVLSKVVFDVLLTGESEAFNIATSSFGKFIEFVVSGGNSPFYFFFALIFITVLAESLVFLFRRMRNTSVRFIFCYLLLFGSCVLIVYLSIVGLFTAGNSGQAFKVPAFISSLALWDYNPLNFLPYIFTAAIAVQEFNMGRFNQLNRSLKTKLWILFCLFLMFSTLEWIVLDDLLQHKRLSLIFGSWLLLYLALISTPKVPAIVKFISDCSLGIYAFHVFFTSSLFPYKPDLLSSVAQISPALEVLAKFGITLVSSITLTYFFKRVKALKNFI